MKMRAIFCQVFCVLTVNGVFSGRAIAAPSALEVLGLPTGASKEEVKEAFRTKAKEFHPDTAKTESHRLQLAQVMEAYRFIQNRGFRTDDITSDVIAKSKEQKKVAKILQENQSLIHEPTDVLILLAHEISDLKTLEDYLEAIGPFYEALFEELQALQPNRTKIEILKSLNEDVFTHLREDKDHPHGNYLFSEALIKVAYRHLDFLKTENPRAHRELKERALDILDQLEQRAFAYDLGGFYQRLIFELTRSCVDHLR